MLATAHVVYDEHYFAALYDDWLQHRSVWRRYAIYFAVAMLAAGIGMVIIHRQHWLVGAVIAAFGAYETVSAITHRRRWLNERLLLARHDKTADLSFDETSVASTSANGTSTMLVSRFMGFAAATNGFFLIPDTGISLYVPRAAVEPADAYEELVSMLSSAVANSMDASNADG